MVDLQHIFIAEIDGKEIDMATMMPEEKQKAVMEMTRKFVEHFGYQQEKTAYAVPVGQAKEG